MKQLLLLALATILAVSSCSKKDDPTPAPSELSGERITGSLTTGYWENVYDDKEEGERDRTRLTFRPDGTFEMMAERTKLQGEGVGDLEAEFNFEIYFKGTYQYQGGQLRILTVEFSHVGGPYKDLVKDIEVEKFTPNRVVYLVNEQAGTLQASRKLSVIDKDTDEHEFERVFFHLK